MSAPSSARAGARRTPTMPVSRLWWLAAGLVYAGLLPLFKLWPGLMPTLPISLLEFGSSACLAEQPWTTLTCPTVGMPRGLVVAFGLPVIWLSARLQQLTGLDVATAYRCTEALFVLVALLTAARFFRLFTGTGRAAPWLGLFVAALYLMAPNIVREDLHGALRIGFALVPAYVLADVLFTRALRNGATPSRLAWAWLGLTTLRTFALFCDGYSFVMALLVAGLLWAITLLPMLRRGPRLRALLGGLLGLASVAVPVLLYKLYIPESQYPTMPLDFFRGQGIDAYFFLVPAISLWIPTLLGLAVDIPGPVVHSVGPSSHMVYLGYALLLAGVLALAWLGQRRWRPSAIGLALGLAGAIALLLSLGPEFKWMNFDWNASEAITFQTYLMPPGGGRFTLPMAWVYEHVPGIDVMRALYRWVLLPRLALLAALAAVLAWLFARPARAPRIAAALLALLALAESLPNLPLLIRQGHDSAAGYAALVREPIAQMADVTRPGERALFLALHPGASGNPYFANLLCAQARLRCYDVGGDKSRRISAEDWPAPVAAVAEHEQPLPNARRVLAQGLADVLVVPFFDLRWNLRTWPPVAFPRDAVERQLGALQQRWPELRVTRTPWLATLRLAPTRRAALADLPPAHYAMTSAAQVLDWEPRRLQRGADDVYLWVRLAEAPRQPRLLLDDWPLLTYRKSDGTVAAWIRHVDWAHFRAGGVHTVTLLDDAAHTRQAIGQVEIASLLD